MATTLTDNQCRTCGGSTGTDITDHEAAADPHSQYLTQAEGDGFYAATGDAATAIATHEGAADPHTVYLLETDAASTYRTGAQVTTSVTSGITSHTSALDPHTQYLTEARGDARYGASGWASYGDTANTTGSPFIPSAATATALPNDGVTAVETQLPTGVTEFWDGTDIPAAELTEGDLLEVEISFIMRPSAAASYVTVWLSDSVTDLNRQSYSAPIGTGENFIKYTTVIPINSDAATNGLTPMIETDDASNDFFEIEFRIASLFGA